MKNLLLALVSALASVYVMAVVNLNTATQAELETLKGVGPSKAKAIVDYRQKNGAFKSVDELDNVPGFGKATLDKLRPELTVSGASSSVAKPQEKPAEKPAKPVKAGEKAAKPAEKKP
ncbi:helix-hairpin-helix domain-containing protein [Chitinimonas arctica]|uniref:Helix-hairpin-helix domain-containing protein n=1 Tax=Chitinimonas arctica TaxID=2594795 RepID=A0A516SI94_9NEIS|nr:helix-hairpin-helix domain-containing protein [Chitinimonas arctica]QDQ27874.1 helix-hairpin-helix domain-containing protein [Chitinimonas arctica]